MEKRRFVVGPRSTRVAVEPDDELDRTLCGAAAAARAGDLGLPIRLLLVETASGLAAFRDRRPGFGRPRRVGDTTARRDGHLTRVRWFAFGHAKATGLFGGGWKLGRHLRAGAARKKPRQRHS